MSGIGLDLNIRQRLEQRQVLSLQTIQSLKILQLASTDLQDLIQQEMETNPALEVADPEPEAVPVETATEAQQGDGEARTEAGETITEAYEFLERNTDYEDFGPGPRVRDNGEPDAKQEAFNNLAADEPALTEHLLEQLRLRGMHEEDRSLLEAIVYSLDDRGYLAYPVHEIIAPLVPRPELEDAEEALRIIQALDPRGVGARSLAECLLLQIKTDDPDYPALKALLTDHWSDVASNRLPKVAKAMGVNVDEIKLYLDMLSVLDPAPGLRYGGTKREFITPDVIIDEDEHGALRVRLTREHLPRLQISDYYRNLLKTKGGDKQTLNFLKAKLNGARALIEALEQRQSTLERVANAILRRQPRYFREGIQALVPMKMQDIADELGIHHSTVWRAVYQKYAETPVGIVALNELFTGGLTSSENEEGAVSREAVKVKLKAIVEGEDKKKPLSDMSLAQLLAKEGIKASRRVVTKYREELGIADSRERRAY